MLTQPPARRRVLRLSPVLLAAAAILLAAPCGPLNAVRDRLAPTRPVEVTVRVIATKLDTPWALAFAPDGRLFLTERPGRIRVIDGDRLVEAPLATLPVAETAEGGLMGLAVDPGFPQEPYLYVMYTYSAPQGPRNRVARLRVEGASAREDKVLLDDLPAGSIHDGGRVRFGPDGLLYVTLVGKGAGG